MKYDLSFVGIDGIDCSIVCKVFVEVCYVLGEVNLVELFMVFFLGDVFGWMVMSVVIFVGIVMLSGDRGIVDYLIINCFVGII